MQQEEGSFRRSHQGVYSLGIQVEEYPAPVDTMIGLKSMKKFQKLSACPYNLLNGCKKWSQPAPAVIST